MKCRIGGFMLSAEGTGRSIEKAIENALLELKAKREDVDIKILEEGGIFKKAKVLVTISEDSEEKYKKTEKERKDKVEEIEEKLDVKAMFADFKKEESKKEEKINKEVRKAVAIKKDKKVSGKDFIKELLKLLNIEANVFVEENSDEVLISVEGGNSGDLIGYRGECLNAIQHIASIIEKEANDSRKRLILDIEKYRARREESLRALANRMENKVVKTNRSMKLEPMTPNERRIIHTELQKSELVTTISKGTEPSRFIVILPKKDKNEE